ncbi:MAG: 23S rRNA (guanosine(2251)-2'-O)-methyltransferase RlmB [Steroidobacteraceae bacterium]
MSADRYVHGVHAVRALLSRSPGRVQELLLAETRNDTRSAELQALAVAAGARLQRISLAQLDRLSGEGVHQGVAARVAPLEPWREEDLLQAITAHPRPLVLVLDGVQDPHNLGACLRTADACGALAVVVPRDRAVQVNATVRKVAAGAAETTPVVSVTNLARHLELLKQAGCWIYGADASAAQAAASADLRGAVALVLGAEGRGLRELTRKRCDGLLRLPMRGTVESLNVSVAAGMLLYEVLRQRERSEPAAGP